MGTWGTAIFSDDLAIDIRNAYEDMLRYGREPVEAEAEIIAEFGMEDDDVEPAAWFALAATEWKCGRHLSERVKSTAISLIDSNADIDMWETAKQRASRHNALQKLREQLFKPLPRPKRLKKLPTVKSPWRIGDVLAVKMVDFPDNADVLQGYPELAGKYTLIQVVNIDEHKLSKYAPDSETSESLDFIMYYWWGDDLSQVKETLTSKRICYLKRTIYEFGVQTATHMRSIFHFDIIAADVSVYNKYQVVAHVEMAPFADLADKTRYGGGVNDACMPYYTQRWLSEAIPIEYKQDVIIHMFE